MVVPRITRPLAQPVRLSPVRKLTRAHLALARKTGLIDDLRAALAATSAHLSTQLGVGVQLEARLSDATLHPVTTLARHALFVTFEVNGDGVVVLELDLLAVGALLTHAAGGATHAAAPFRLTRIEEAALGWLLLTTLSAVRGSEPLRARFCPRLISLFVDRNDLLEAVDARRKHLAVQLAVKVGEVHGGARLLVPSTWLQTVLESVPDAAAAPCQPSVLAAELEAPVMVGTMALSRREAAALRRGDVIVFPGLTTEGTELRGPGRLALPTLHLRGAFGATGFTLTTAQEPAVSKQNPSLPVDVEIELTRLRLPLHQLGTLQPGAVLPLHINAAQSVTLRIGDRAVAKAELVDIEGEIGARIIAML